MRPARAQAKSGQAMIETVIVSLFLLLAFFLVAQYADDFRTKLLLQHAAARVARAKTVGFNAFTLEKTARIATLPVSGRCRATDDADRPLSLSRARNLCGAYLETPHAPAAAQVLDYEYWQDGRLAVSAVRSGARIVARVSQRRPQFFDLRRFLDGREAAAVDAGEFPADAELDLSGAFTIESHAPDYLENAFAR